MSDLDGVVTITLGGRDFDIKPTWKAIANIEDALGYGMVQFGMSLVRKSYTTRDLSIVVYYGLLACDEKALGVSPTLEKVSELVYKEGLMNVDLIASVLMFCEYALSGGKPETDSAKGKPKATQK